MPLVLIFGPVVLVALVFRECFVWRLVRRTEDTLSPLDVRLKVTCSMVMEGMSEGVRRVSARGFGR